MYVMVTAGTILFLGSGCRVSCDTKVHSMELGTGTGLWSVTCANAEIVYYARKV